MSEPDNFIDVNAVVKDLQEIMEPNPMRDELFQAVLQLKKVCGKYSLPLEQIGFWGDIGIDRILGIKMHNTQYDEIGKEE